MLTDIQAMIVDYKKKSHYSNLVTNHETEDEAHLTAQNLCDTQEEPARMMAHTSKNSTQMFEGQEMQVPQSRLTYRTGDSFDVSVTSRSQSRSRGELSRSMSRSGSRPRGPA